MAHALQESAERDDASQVKTLLGWSLAAAVLLCFSGAPSAAAAPSPDRVPLPPDRVTQLARPATVLIETKLTGNVSMAGPPEQEVVIERLLSTDARLRAAAVRGDETATERRIYELMAERPQDFLGPKYSESIDETGTGTGFVVGSGGVVLTNSHVVIGNGTAADLVEMAELESPADIEEVFIDAGFARKDPALAERAAKALADAFVKSIEVKDINRTVTVRRLAVSGGESFNASVVRATSAYPAEDLAVLQVAELANTPSLPFATIEPRAGEEAYALGFPGAATFGAGTDERSQLVPSLTKGVVSATKTSEKGVPIVQFDASLAPGNSGGPLLNNHGEVVGVNVIGADSPGNFNFAISGQRALGYLTEGGAEVKTPEATTALESAVRALHAGWLSAAGDHLNDLEKLSPSELAVKDLRAELDGRIARKERDLTPTDASVVVPGAAAAALLAVATAGTVVSALTRRRGRGSGRKGPPDPVEDLAVWARPDLAPSA